MEEMAEDRAFGEIFHGLAKRQAECRMSNVECRMGPCGRKAVQRKADRGKRNAKAESGKWTTDQRVKSGARHVARESRVIDGGDFGTYLRDQVCAREVREFGGPYPPQDDEAFLLNSAPPNNGRTKRLARMSMTQPARTTRPKRCVGGKSDRAKMAKPAAIMTSE